MKTSAVSGSQVHHFTLSYCCRELTDGLSIVYGGLQETARVYIDRAKMKLQYGLLRFRGRRLTRDLEQSSSEAKGDEADSQQVGYLSAANSSTSLAELVGKRNGGLSQWNDRLKLAREDNDQPASLHYGFVLLSKMLNVSIQFIPALTLNLRFGLSPSRTFLMLSYLLMIVVLITGVHLSSFILGPSIQMFVGRMDASLQQICIVSLAIGQVGFISYSLATSAYVLYQRKFLQKFVYHKCSIITLTRSYQRRQMVSIFLAFNLFALTAEPLFSLLALSHDVHQPAYWPQLEATTFKLTKWLAMLGCGLGTCAISSGTVIIPLMTCFLITAAMKHLKNLVQKQSSRCQQTAIWKLTTHSQELVGLLNSKTRYIMEEFACETLTMDWPLLFDILAPNLDHDNSITQTDSVPIRSAYSMGNEVSPRASPQLGSFRPFRELSPKSDDLMGGISLVNPDVGLDLNLMLDAISGKLNSSKASSLLFLYKNLIKSLSELKAVILDYEVHFGNFHQILSLISSLIVSLWVTSAFTEARRGQSSDASKTSSSANLLADAGGQMGLDQANSTTTTPMMAQEEEYKQNRVAYSMRIACCTISFVLSNVYVFLKCDCLSDRLNKIRSQLFKMNIDLACTFISAQKKYNRELTRELATKQMIRPTIRIQGVMPETSDSSSHSNRSFNDAPSSPKLSKRFNVLSKSVYEVNHWKHDVKRTQFEHFLNQCSELDQIWSLYDQVCRISSKVNFRFSSDTYYSKKCMLLVFGRSVSLVLFFIQIIDMYST